MACPVPGRWGFVAAGLEPEPESEELLEHAATCARCAALLKEAVEVLRDDEQQQSNVISFPAPSRWKWWIAAAAGIVLAVGVLYGFQIRLSRQAAVSALATLAEQHWLGDVERSLAPKVSTGISEAESVLAAHQGRNNASWLEGTGLVALLRGNAEEAILQLQLALASVSDQRQRARIEMDLAIAYYVHQQPAHSVAALEQARRYDPSLTNTDFYRGIAYEQARDYSSASAAFRDYLSRVPGGRFAAAAKKHISNLPH